MFCEIQRVTLRGSKEPRVTPELQVADLWVKRKTMTFLPHTLLRSDKGTLCFSAQEQRSIAVSWQRWNVFLKERIIPMLL